MYLAHLELAAVVLFIVQGTDPVQPAARVAMAAWVRYGPG
jgi:hypothetical protein